MTPKFTLDLNAIERMATDPVGVIYQECDRAAEALAINAKFTLGSPYAKGFPNPAPGPPRMRTGDLFRSIRVAKPGQITGGSPGTFYVISDATIASHDYPRGSYYPRWLLDHGYKFLSFELAENFSFDT